MDTISKQNAYGALLQQGSYITKQTPYAVITEQGLVIAKQVAYAVILELPRTSGLDNRRMSLM